jgi:DNA-binding FadR family transcriptional regulator
MKSTIADTPVRAPKLSHVVAEQLRSKIATGLLKAGDSLPSEGDLLKQFGMRMLLEPPLVSLLASRAKKDLVRLLTQTVAQQRQALEADDFAGAVAAISEFHGQLLMFSQNRALGLLVGMLREILPAAYARLLQTGSDSLQKMLRRRTVKSSAAHAQLVQIILNGQAAEAEAFWRQYMEETAAFLQEARIANVKVEIPTRRY